MRWNSDRARKGANPKAPVDKAARSRRRRRLGLVALTTTSLTLFTASAPLADINDSMDGYWSSSIGSANVTGPTAFQGQSAGYYTLGNVAFRGPQETTQIGAIQLPSVRAGCGGIDIFSGGFSFINSDQLVAHMKAVASNAISYAFMLAIKSLSPIVADQIESLQKVAGDVNQFNMNSCQQAQALVGGLWGRSDTASNQICTDLSTYRGFYSDRIAARHDCPNRMAQNLNNLPESDKKVIPINKNIAWEATRQHPMLAGDRELAELFMTLTGTIIYKCPDNNGCIIDVLPAEGAKDGVITKLLDGGAVRVHRCDTTDKCLNPVKYGGTQTLAANRALKNRVEAMLRSIITKIQTRQTLSAAEQDFLNMVSLPVYKMASVYSAQQGAAAAGTMAQYADVIALDMVYTWINRSVSQVEDGARNMVGVDEAQLAEWRESIEQVRSILNERQQVLNTKTSAIEDMIARTQRAEQQLAARMGTRIGETIAFSASMTPN